MDIKSESEDDRTSDDDFEQTSDLENEDTTEPEHMRKLFVGGLDYRTTDYGLKLYFEQFGELVDMVVIKDPKTRTSRGFGFVTFSSAYMADDALMNGPHVIDGRTVEIKRVVPRDEVNSSESGETVKKSSVSKGNKSDENDTTEPEHMRKLFVGGLDYRTTDYGLKLYFEQFGELVDVVVIKDPKTRTSRGFGFVTFSSASMADEAQEDEPHIIDGRTVEIKRVVPRNEAKNSETDETVNEDDVTEPEYMRKLFIGGLDYRTTDEGLREYFEQFGDLVDVVVIKDPKTKTSRGFGFVKYSKAFMLDEAQSKRPHKIDGRTVETKRVVPRNKANSLEDSVTVKKLFVGGLKEDFDEDDIREEFSQFGTILDVIIPMEKDSQKKRGFAFVEFDDYDAVDKACLKKDITIKNKKVDVKKALSKNEMMMQQGNRVGGMNSGAGDGGGSGGGPWGGRSDNNQNTSGFGDNRGGWGNQGNFGGPGGPGGPGCFNQGGYNNAGPWPPRGPSSPPNHGWGPSGPPPNHRWGVSGPPNQGWGNNGPPNQGWGNNPGSYRNPGNSWNCGPNNFGNNYGQSFGGGPSRNQNFRQNKRSIPYKAGPPMGGNMISDTGGGRGYGMGGCGPNWYN